MPKEPEPIEEVQISISGVPTDLLNDIDALAQAESEELGLPVPRAAYIRRLLQQRVDEIKGEQRKKRAA